MSGPKQRVLPAAVDGVRQRIEEWRNTREKRTRMPEELWGAAASLARAHGLWAVSRALRVNYECLKRRCGQVGARRRGDGRVARRANFVELAATQVSGPTEPTGPVLELSRVDGAKLTIRLAGCDALDVSALAGAFWEGGP